MKKKLMVTKCGLFLREITVIDSNYSEEELNEDGSLRAIEKLTQMITWKPILLWNPKKYNMEVCGKKGEA